MSRNKSYVIISDQFSEGDLCKFVDILGFDKDDLAVRLIKMPGMTEALKKERARFIEDQFPGNYIPDASEMNHALLDAEEHLVNADVIIRVADKLLSEKKAHFNLVADFKRKK